MNRVLRLAPALVLAGLATGCKPFDEGIIVEDLTGKIIVPREAATRTFFDAEGNPQEITDVRLLGPVYLGLYPSVVEGVQSYAHPETGPAFEPGVPGDTYPYGGTSVGDIRFPCLEFLKCKVVSGRYVDFDAMVTWFNETLDEPITDANGEVVQSGDFIAQQCFELLNYVDESEIRLTATADRNDDGQIDEKDLDFVERSDGNFEADFVVWQQEWFEHEETGAGFTLWGWMDAPSTSSNQFTTCNPTGGYLEDQYNRDFYGGRPYQDLLNVPSKYIYAGDWVATEGYVYETPTDDNVEITLGFKVGAL